MISSIHLSGLDNFDKSLDAMVARMNQMAKVAVTTGGHTIERAYKELYRGRPGGSQRVSRTTGKMYYSSAPPAQSVPDRLTQRSGADRNSVRVEVTELSAGVYQSRTGPTMVYSRAINLGNPSNMAPNWQYATSGGKHPAPIPARPQLRHALDLSLPVLRQQYADLWREAQVI